MRPPPPLPAELLVHEVPRDEEMTVFRIVTTDDTDSVAFIDSFRSHAELGIPPRRGSPEIAHPAIHRGISVLDRRERAVATALKWRKLGDFVAAVRLDRVAGATYYIWERPRGHLTVWGDAVKLARATTDIVCVTEATGPSGLPDSRQRGERSRLV